MADISAELEEILIEQGVISSRELQDAWNNSQLHSLEDFLIQQRGISEEAIAFAIANGLDIPFIPTIPAVQLSDLQAYPLDILKKYSILPLQENEHLIVILSKYLTLEERSFVEKTFANHQVYFAIGMPSKVRETLYQALSDESESSIFVDDEQDVNKAILYLTKHLKKAREYSISEISLYPNAQELETFYRLRDKFIPQDSAPKYYGSVIGAKLKTLAKINSEEKVCSAYLTFKINEQETPLHLSILPSKQGELIQITLHNSHQVVWDESVDNSIFDISQIPSGVVILVTPTFAKMRRFAHYLMSSLKDERKILSLEKHITFQMDSIPQIDLNTYVDAAEYIHQHQPDIVYIERVDKQCLANICAKTLVLIPIVACSVEESIGIIKNSMQECSRKLRAVVEFNQIEILCSCKQKIETPRFVQQNTDLTVVYDKSGCEKCSYSGSNSKKWIANFAELNKVDTQKVGIFQTLEKLVRTNNVFYKALLEYL